MSVNWQILQGDCLAHLRELPHESVQCCVTSPPYWGLRDYGVEGQLGLERTPEEFVGKLVIIFREVRRVLKKDGTLWLNLGDSYATGAGGVGECPGGGKQGENWKLRGKTTPPNRLPLPGLKPKDLCGIPWRCAFALQQDGWYLRSDIIWAKPNPMPESVTDRPTKSHEYIFLMAKSERYFYDSDAIKEPAVCADEAQWAGDMAGLNSGESWVGTGKSTRRFARGGRNAFRGQGHFRDGSGPANRDGRDMADVGATVVRNKRTVWNIATKPFKGAHFATFPPKLIEPCILAGSKRNDTVLDPFSGAGTTGLVALRHGRTYLGIELNPDYVEMSKRRIESDAPLFNTMEVTP
jgi:DNA modification methylase